MLRLKVLENGAPARAVDLEGAYLVGNDRVPLRATLEFANGEIRCETRTRGAAALSLMWPVAGVGRVMLETTRLPERPRPYNLHVELARGQLMRISHKREEWGLYDFPDGKPIYDQIDAARDLLIAAVTAPDDAAATGQGDAAIAAGVRVGEALGIFHADLFLKRRHAAGQLAHRPLGCRLDASVDSEAYLRGLEKAFDFASVPFHWRAMEPREGKYQVATLEQRLDQLRRRKIPIRGCSLLSFENEHLPKWLAGRAGSFESVRECVTKRLKHAFKLFGDRVRTWEVISGVHAQNAFQLSFEQIMELTRMSVILAKQMAPRSKTIVGIVLPWGEYYARDTRTIPPMLYAEMVVQSGLDFDAFGLEMRFGHPGANHYVRDMMQVSSILDRFGNLGKPVHITAAGVPSGGSAAGGSWHGDWSEEVQARWARDFYQVALSKPFVETVCWQTLADGADGKDAGGMLRTDLSPKPAYQEILAFRKKLLGRRPAVAAQGSSSASETKS